jgi:branched-chain amino acid transport system permease protein
MERLQQKNLLTVLALFLLLIVLLLFAGFGSSAYFQRIMIGLGISIILVVSLNLSNGFTGVFSLGHVSFMAIGAYTAAILTLPISLKQVNLPDLPSWLANVELSFLLATLIGGLLAVVVAFLMGLSLMRLSGAYVSVATMGLLVITQVILINWDTMTRGSRTFSGVPGYTNLWWAWAGAMTRWRLAHWESAYIMPGCWLSAPAPSAPQWVVRYGRTLSCLFHPNRSISPRHSMSSPCW